MHIVCFVCCFYPLFQLHIICYLALGLQGCYETDCLIDWLKAILSNVDKQRHKCTAKRTHKTKTAAIYFPGEPGSVGFIEATDDGSGGDNWSYKAYKASDKSSPPTNQHPVFHRPDALPVAQPTVSKHCWKTRRHCALNCDVIRPIVICPKDTVQHTTSQFTLLSDPFSFSEFTVTSAKKVMSLSALACLFACLLAGLCSNY